MSTDLNSPKAKAAIKAFEDYFATYNNDFSEEESKAWHEVAASLHEAIYA